MGGQGKLEHWWCGVEGTSVLPNQLHSSGVGCFEACVWRLQSCLISSLPRDPFSVAAGRERASEGQICASSQQCGGCFGAV